MLGNSVAAVIVVRTRPRAIPLAIITTIKSTRGFPFLFLYEYGALLGGPLGRQNTIKNQTDKSLILHNDYMLVNFPWQV